MKERIFWVAFGLIVVGVMYFTFFYGVDPHQPGGRR